MMNQTRYNYNKMAARSSKKAVNRQPIIQEIRSQVVDRQLFTLQYLHHTLNYVLFDNKSLQHYLEVDQNVLNTIVHNHPSDLGLHYVQRIKLMKERCSEDLFVKDLQQYGDFINYDLPNSYQRDLKTIEIELEQEISMQIDAKRLKKYYPFLTNRMTLNEVETMNRRLKQQILSQLMNNVEMIPEEQEEHLEKNTLYREMFGITGYVKEELIQIGRGIEKIHHQENRKHHSCSENGISSKMKHQQRNIQKEKKGQKSLKSRKILKIPKKEEGITNQYQQYLPKSIMKKLIKNDQNQLIIERPVLQNPFSEKQKQQMGIKIDVSIILHEEGNQIKQQNMIPIGEQKQEQKMLIANQTPRKIDTKENIVKIKKEHSETKNEDNQVISNSQQTQKVKRQYNRAHKDNNHEGQVKREKVAKSKGEKLKQKIGQLYKKETKISEEQAKKKKNKKIQHLMVEPVCIIKEPISDTNINQKAQTSKSYVSIAIQTNTNPEITINQQKNDIPQMVFDEGIKNQDKKNLIQQFRFEEPKQDEQFKNSSILMRSENLRSSNSYQNPSINESRRLSGIRIEHSLDQSQMSISNPFYSENIPEPINEEVKSQHIPEEENELDISQFLN